MSCNNCGNCYGCLSDSELSYNYNKVMSRSIYDRIKFRCNCYMCNDLRSASCIEVSLMNKDFNFDLINEEICKIRKQIKKDNKSLIRRYILCLIKFNSLYENVLRIRYKPPFGKGYIEAKNNFEKLRYINSDIMDSDIMDSDIMDSENACGEYFQHKLFSNHKIIF